MIELRRLKNDVIFIQTILSLVLSKQTKIPLTEKHIPNSCFWKTIMQCAISATLHLCMLFMASSFREEFKDQTLKNSK